MGSFCKLGNCLLIASRIVFAGVWVLGWVLLPVRVSGLSLGLVCVVGLCSQCLGEWDVSGVYCFGFRVVWFVSLTVLLCCVMLNCLQVLFANVMIGRDRIKYW